MIIIFGKLQSVHLIGRPSAVGHRALYYLLSVSDHNAFGYIASSEGFVTQFYLYQRMHLFLSYTKIT